MKPDVGQVWQDCDWRCRYRQIRIVMVDIIDGTALCFARDDNNDSWHPLRRRIRLSRFRPTSTGYRFVGYANDGGPGPAPPTVSGDEAQSPKMRKGNS